MIYKILNFTLIFIIFLFIYFLTKFYFSDENKKNLYENSLELDKKFTEIIENIPLLKNDTENVIEFNNFENNSGINENKKFWNLLNK